ncbi:MULTISPECIES: hypothetical protein [unclassified Streptomyces]|uniref:hypothetical protein n=1 Tax=unclassified Streptomyces TaxID=2593676 RepID=UPI0037F72C58
MIRRETFCDGRLVKEIDQVDVSTRSLREQFIDGCWRWLLDGEEVQDVEAEAFRTVWDAQH